METFKYSYKIDKEENILVNVYNCGYQKCVSGYSMGPLVRRNYLMHHVFAGKGTLTVHGKTYAIQTGDTFLITPNTVAHYEADVEEPWEYYWVGFDGAEVKNLIDRTDFSADCAVIQSGQSEVLKNLLMRLYGASGNTFHHQIRMVGYLYLILSVLLETAHKPQIPVDISMTYSKKAVDYIAAHYEKHITITDIAAELGVSRSHLYRVFVRHMGESPKVYLERFRIQQACILLVQTVLAVNEVANSVGYDDQLHFSKVFKKMKGVSPKEYRRSKSSARDT